jgi:hypothetical protein
MPTRFLETLSRSAAPVFVTQRSELHLLRRLQGAGYVEARFFPQERTADQFAELLCVTPLGRRVLEIVARCGAPLGA